MGIKKLDFLEDVFLKKQIFKFYKKKGSSFQPLSMPEKHQLELNLKNLLIIRDFPGYLNSSISPIHKFKNANMYEGFYISLQNYKNIDAYLLEQFSSKRRSKHKALKKRLELCFNIRYEIYYGEIEEEEYHFLFDQLQLMIKKRFAAKKMKHAALDKLESFRNTMYLKILEKTATLSVIYHNKKPLSIALNLIEQDIYIGYVMTFDTDYSKFYPGFINIERQLKWCFENNFRVFDLMKGDLSYKKIYADSSRPYQCHILYSPKQILSHTIASFAALKLSVYYKIFYLLKAWGLQPFYRKIKTYRYSLSQKNTHSGTKPNIRVINLPSIPSNTKLVEIDIEDEAHAHARKFVYDFLYATSENIKAVKICEIPDQSAYLAVGHKKQILIQYNPQA